MNERDMQTMNDQDFVNAITGNTGDSGWRNMVPQVNSSDFPTQWVPSAYECNIIDAQTKEIEKLRAQLPRWIPVEERLPETQGWYHVAIRDEKTKRIAVELDLYSVETAKNFGHETGFCKDGRWDGREKVIAWMPLPEPPEVENA